MERKIVVVAPTFNETDNITSFLEAVLKYKYKVVVADSHSLDGTKQKVLAFKNKGVVYLDVKERGLGLGLLKGIDYAFDKLDADAVATMEADLSNDPKQLGEFIKKLSSADLVVGSRYVSGGVIPNWSWWRKALSLGANYLLRLLAFAPNLHEFTNLYRVFNKGVWSKIKAKVGIHRGWIFVPAFIFEALGEEIKMVEQPIVYNDRFGGRSKMNTVSYTKDLLHYAIKYRLEKSASFFKFMVVGGLGFAINTAVLLVGVHFGMTPANAGFLGAEFAIVSNFIWNNIWTFSDRQISFDRSVILKFLQFNLLSFGSAVIQFISLKIGEMIFGLATYKGPIIDLPYLKIISWYMLFYVGGVGLGLIWNYLMYSKVIWKKK